MTTRRVLWLMLLTTLFMRMDVIRAEDSDESAEDIDEEGALQAELQVEADSAVLAELQVEADSAVLAELPVEADSAVMDEELRQQAEDNASALKRLAEVMKNLIHETSRQRCLGTGTNTQELTTSIKEGFSILVGAVQDLNNTLRHFKEEINQKAFSDSSASAFEDDGPCPSPFFPAGDDCLYIETEHLRYFDAARQACIDMGAKLAEFTTFDPFISAVRNMDMHDGAEIYVGATDEEREGTWRWVSGGRVGSIPWAFEEPNNAHGREHCLALGGRSRRFNDIPCAFRREYACVKK